MSIMKEWIDRAAAKAIEMEGAKLAKKEMAAPKPKTRGLYGVDPDGNPIMRIRNLTGHEITVLGVDETTTVIRPDPEGPARIKSYFEPLGADSMFTKSKLVSSWGIPEPEEGTVLIVSSIIKMVLAERRDLCVPSMLIRNQANEVQACRCLTF